MKSIEDARDKIRDIDSQMGELFVRRMDAVRDVAAYKKERGLPILDEVQEKKVLERNSAYVQDEALKKFYLMFLKDTMAVSRKYQEWLIYGKNDEEASGSLSVRIHEMIAEEAGPAEGMDAMVNCDGYPAGYNTDYYGLRDLILHAGIEMEGKKVLILGGGPAGKTAVAVSKDMGASLTCTISRAGAGNVHVCEEIFGTGNVHVCEEVFGTGNVLACEKIFGPESALACVDSERAGTLSCEEAYSKYKDTDILINTSSSAIFPCRDECPVDLTRFPGLTGVIDTISHPLRTPLVLKAQDLGIPAEGGLYMLVSREVYAKRLFRDRKFDRELIDKIYHEILLEKRNIVLTGMSLAGKTTVGGLLSEKLGKKFVDMDDEIVAREHRSITDIFASDGEKYFRDVESEIARDLGKENGIVIATGGGVILRKENVEALKKNGIIIFLDRMLEQITPMDDRPLANTADKVAALFEKRYPIYSSTCDLKVPNNHSASQVTDRILDILTGIY